MVPYFKIASADITNFPLLKKSRQKKKLHFYQLVPQILTKLKNAINILKKNGFSYDRSATLYFKLSDKK